MMTRSSTVVTTSWANRHFPQAKTRDPDQGDVPILLRRVADTIEELGPVEAQDLTVWTHITEDGPATT
jgi:hypothetical protein